MTKANPTAARKRAPKKPGAALTAPVETLDAIADEAAPEVDLPFGRRGLAKPWCTTLGGITVDATGIWGPFGKDGATKRIHHLPLMPLATVHALGADGKNRLYVELKYRTLDGREGTATLETHELSSFARRDHPLVRDGWQSPSPRNMADVAMAVGEMVRELDVPSRTGYEVCGWHGHATHIRPGLPSYVGGISGSTEAAGDPMVWKKVMTELITDSPALALGAAFTVASLLRGVVPLPHTTAHILHYYGQPSRGKSTILRALATFAGVPDKPGYVDGASTARGLENRMAASNHGFILIDEMDQLLANAMSDTGAGTLMFLTNGGGREKSSRGGEQIMGPTWSSHIVTTGNGSLLALSSAAKKSDALATRIFEIDIMDAELATFRTPSALDARIHKLTQNYGHGYPAAIAHIMANRPALIEAYGQYVEELRGTPTLARLFEDQARLLVFFSLTMMGADILAATVSPAAGRACHAAIADAMARYEQDPEEASSQTAVRGFTVLDALRDFIKRNSGRFIWRGYAWSENEGSQANAARDAAFMARNLAGGALGEMQQTRPMKSDDDLEGTLTLSARALDELERRESLSKSELIEAAKLFGVLLTQSGREDVKLSAALQTALGGSRGLRLAMRPLSLADGEKRAGAGQGTAATRHHFLYGAPGDAGVAVEWWDEDTMGPLPEHMQGQQLELMPDVDLADALAKANDQGAVRDPDHWRPENWTNDTEH